MTYTLRNCSPSPGSVNDPDVLLRELDGCAVSSTYRHKGTINWRYSATPAPQSPPAVARERVADDFLSLTEGFVHPVQAQQVGMPGSRRRRARRALVLGLFAAVLALGGVLVEWTDVAASPRLRGSEDVLMIAAVSPSMTKTCLELVSRPGSSVEARVAHIEQSFDLGEKPMVFSESQVSDRLPSADSHVEKFTRARAGASEPSTARRSASADGDKAMVFSRDDLEIPRSLTCGQVSSGLRAVARQVRNCAQGEPDRLVRVSLTIRGESGRVVDASVLGYLGGTTSGACITRALRRARFPRFREQELELHAYPLVLR